MQTGVTTEATEQQHHEIVRSSLNENSKAMDLSGKLSAAVVLSGSLEIFHSMCKMGDMTELDLSNNSLCSLPSAIGNLSCLRRLVLNGNKLQTLPTELSQCSSITELSLQQNELHEVPQVLMELTLIAELDIRLHSSSLLFSVAFLCSF